MKIETPQKRQPCDMSTWHRITEDDGSTVAYVPDIVVDATKALHAFGNLKFALSRAGSE